MILITKTPGQTRRQCVCVCVCVFFIPVINRSGLNHTLYVCMVITCNKGKDHQPDNLANPA